MARSSGMTGREKKFQPGEKEELAGAGINERAASSTQTYQTECLTLSSSDAGLAGAPALGEQDSPSESYLMRLRRLMSSSGGLEGLSFMGWHSGRLTVFSNQQDQ